MIRWLTVISARALRPLVRTVLVPDDLDGLRVLSGSPSATVPQKTALMTSIAMIDLMFLMIMLLVRYSDFRWTFVSPPGALISGRWKQRPDIVIKRREAGEIAGARR